jgi:hypothetical protein
VHPDDFLWWHRGIVDERGVTDVGFRGERQSLKVLGRADIRWLDPRRVKFRPQEP